MKFYIKFWLTVLFFKRKHTTHILYLERLKHVLVNKHVYKYTCDRLHNDKDYVFVVNPYTLMKVLTIKEKIDLQNKVFDLLYSMRTKMDANINESWFHNNWERIEAINKCITVLKMLQGQVSIKMLHKTSKQRVV